MRDDICLVDEIQPGVFCIISTAREMQDTAKPTTFLEVLREWGCSWLWEHMTIVGRIGMDCTSNHSGITGGCNRRVVHMAVISTPVLGSICPGMFIRQRTARQLVQGELLGLMAIHLFLVSVNWAHKSLSGSAKVVSNCLGALQRVTYLPPYQIPSRCKHSDILKKYL